MTGKTCLVVGQDRVCPWTKVEKGEKTPNPKISPFLREQLLLLRADFVLVEAQIGLTKDTIVRLW